MHLIVVVNGLLGFYTGKLLFVDSLQKSLGANYLVYLSAASSGFGTLDGIAEGGNRLVAEVKQVVVQNPQLTDISFVGLSLGGLYCRHAIKELVSDERIFGLKPCAYVSIASPHLGIRHSATPLQQFLCEKALGTTGLELLLQDEHMYIHKLSTRDYVAALAAFESHHSFYFEDGDERVPRYSSCMALLSGQERDMTERLATVPWRSHIFSKDHIPYWLRGMSHSIIVFSGFFSRYWQPQYDELIAVLTFR
jgi:hypothetical protein